ncbi:hypothetical protein TAMA11512_06770 [Selenomonas sp. TAMA-11512]|uniref:hypothetical protein n=1 Tax=Selenomonas sp. TAMA-11512 TaxID=3095337 RepID=UPI00308BAC37|nr:hypothetical protein TAMA11512_06770 [Selenomonas sp. TAMA-11512]
MAERDKLAHKAHIQAAQNWLGKAASSLEAENEIRSDLHLMLAEAELRRANRHSLLTRGVKLALPPLAAVLIVLAGNALLHSEWQKDAQTTELPVVGAGTQEVFQENKKLAGKEESRVEYFKDSENMSVAPAMTSPDTNETVQSRVSADERSLQPVLQEAAQEAAPENALTVEQPSSVLAENSAERRTVPDPDMQQLMQSAAVILRK